MRPRRAFKDSRFFDHKIIYIADGHHRYQTALSYQQERRASELSGTGSEAYNYVMMTLIDSHDSGLVINPLWDIG